jgi:hypothetical protein
MKNLESWNIITRKLDLSEWWEQIKLSDVEFVIDNKDKWNYWWFNEDKTRLTTLKDWKISNYKLEDTEIVFNEDSKVEISHIKQDTNSKILLDLYLTPDNQVKCSKEAYEKAKYFSNKTMFWFVTKWKNKAVKVYDFSDSLEKPEIKTYPLDEYKIKMTAVKI